MRASIPAFLVTVQIVGVLGAQQPASPTSFIFIPPTLKTFPPKFKSKTLIIIRPEDGLLEIKMTVNPDGSKNNYEWIHCPPKFRPALKQWIEAVEFNQCTINGMPQLFSVYSKFSFLPCSNRLHVLFKFPQDPQKASTQPLWYEIPFE
ncbi:MAG: hypothetical protein HY823_14020 [Acidobacteria bacterium]|nr:hypothetical protein [Acidobacteriota bacterium]